MVHLIQVTTVNPGAGGQTFIYSQVKKIRRLRRMLAECNLDTPIAVDGGIDARTAPLAVGAGGRIEYLQLSRTGGSQHGRAPCQRDVKD